METSRDTDWVTFAIEPGIGEKAATLHVPASNVLAATDREELRGEITYHVLIKGWGRWVQVSRKAYLDLAERIGFLRDI